jgi:hypothetical protein
MAPLQAHGGSRRTVRLITAGLAAAAATICGTTLAGEALRQIRIAPVEFQAGRFELGSITPDFRNVSVVVQRPESVFRKATGRFESRFLPRASSDLESLSALQLTGMPGVEIEDQVLYGEKFAAVQAFAERATKKAVKHYLLESATIDRTIEDVKSVVRDGSDERGKTHWDFGVHSGLPEVGLRYGMGESAIRFRVSGEGKINLQFRRLDMRHAEFNVGYDGDGGYQVGYIVAF